MRDISKKDIGRLRALASHQAELASGDRMRNLCADWARHGRFEKSARPMFTVELWTFAGEVIPPLLRCEGEKARRLEAMLLGNIVPFEMFGDDTPVRGYLPVPLRKRFVPFGLPVRKNEADFSGAAGVGHHFDAYLHDLEEDWHLLGKSTWSFDEAATQEEIDALNELFGDLLPARRSGETLMVGPAEDIIHLIGMEDLYVAMYDTPDRVHEMMDRLLDDYGEFLDEMEARRLILPTAGDEALPQGSYCFSDSLPCAGTGLNTRQVWGYMDAEEMNDVSPEMYRAFITDHYRRMAQRFGALSFGCCEAIHRVWDGGVETLPNLRKVSVSAWCDQRFMGDRLRGRDIVYLRKPTANLLGVGSDLDEDAVRAYFRETAEAASGCRLEIAQRDVYLLHGSPTKVARYVQLVREALDRHWRP